MTDTQMDLFVIPASSDNVPMTAHIVCGLCVPEVKRGDYALCGAELLGVPNPNGPKCEECPKVVEAHTNRHRQHQFWGR